MRVKQIKDRRDRISEGPPTQLRYEDLVDEMATLRQEKVNRYGEDRYDDPDPQHAMMLLYADIYRKYIRIKQAITSGQWDDSLEDGDSLRDTLLDLGNYALMGVQLLDQHAPQHPVPDPSILPPIDQIAIWCKDPGTFCHIIRDLFGIHPLEGWSLDRVTTDAVVGMETIRPQEHQSAALRFNYSLMQGGLEFEVLNYDSGSRNWLEERDGRRGGVAPCLSHLGVHVSSIEEASTKLIDRGFLIAQDAYTTSHTNPAIKDNRRYHYRIFDTHRVLGFDLKLIERLPYTPSQSQEQQDDEGPQDLE